MRFFTYAFILSFISISAFSQRNCASAEYAARTVATVNLNSVPSLYSRDTIANEIITIPVVVHVLYHNSLQNISDAQIKSQLKVLNDDFRRMNTDAVNTPLAFQPAAADTRIMFCLAQMDPNGRAHSGIIRKYTNKESFEIDDAMKFSAAGGDDAWNSRKYLNIWICKMNNNVIGYASLPGSQADKDGIVVQYDAFGTTGVLNASHNKGRTTIHEVGHWLGLKHIWGDNTCGDDGIGDTPTQFSFNSGCPVYPHLSNCSPDNRGDMFMNYMDYTSDGCMNMFTQDQKIKMRGLFSISGVRNSFMSSFACDSTLATAAPLPVDTTSVVPEITAELSGLSVFPNPATTQIGFVLKGGYDLTGKVIRVVHPGGTVVMQHKMISNEEKLDVSQLHQGIYMLIIGSGSDRKVLKMIKL